MAVYLVRVSVLRFDGAVESVSIREIDAPDLREAMAAVVREMDGWFSVEALDNPRSPEPRVGVRFGDTRTAEEAARQPTRRVSMQN